MDLQTLGGKKLFSAIEKATGKKVSNIKPYPIKNNNSITSRISTKTPGIFELKIDFEDGSKETYILKLKSNDIIKNGISMVKAEKSPVFFMRFLRHHKIFSFNNSYTRDLKIYSKLDPDLRESLPTIITTFKIKNKVAIVMEKFPDGEMEPTIENLEKALDLITDFHACYYNKSFCATSMGLNNFSASDCRKSKDVLKDLFNRLDNEKYFSKFQSLKLENFIDDINYEISKLPLHNTLTHNDFSPRNISLNKKTGKMILYDWELAAYQNPEHDLIELLVSSSENLKEKEIKHLIDFFFDKLETKTKRTLTDSEKRTLLLFNLKEYIVVRLSLLRLFNRYMTFLFIDTMTKNAARLLKFMERIYVEK